MSLLHFLRTIDFVKLLFCCLSKWAKAWFSSLYVERSQLSPRVPLFSYYISTPWKDTGTVTWNLFYWTDARQHGIYLLIRLCYYVTKWILAHLTLLEIALHLHAQKSFHDGFVQSLGFTSIRATSQPTSYKQVSITSQLLRIIRYLQEVWVDQSTNTASHTTTLKADTNLMYHQGC